MTDAPVSFDGAKLLLFLGDQMVILRRDHTPGIPWPGHLDFPGGGREGDETPLDCALRETLEEVGLMLDPREVSLVAANAGPDGRSWFFLAHLPDTRRADIRFGGEGAGWQMMRPEDYVTDPLAIPHFAVILQGYLKRKRPEGA